MLAAVLFSMALTRQTPAMCAQWYRVCLRLDRPNRANFEKPVHHFLFSHALHYIYTIWLACGIFSLSLSYVWAILNQFVSTNMQIFQHRFPSQQIEMSGCNKAHSIVTHTKKRVEPIVDVADHGREIQLHHANEHSQHPWHLHCARCGKKTTK